MPLLIMKAGSSSLKYSVIDGLLFTGGIGEHGSEIRATICDELSCLGLTIDVGANAAARPDAFVSNPASEAAVVVSAAREDLVMARAARSLVG